MIICLKERENKSVRLSLFLIENGLIDLILKIFLKSGENEGVSLPLIFVKIHLFYGSAYIQFAYVSFVLEIDC